MLDAFIEAQDRPATAATYRTALRQFAAWIGDECATPAGAPVPLASVRLPQFVGWRDEMERRGWAPATVHLKLDALRSFYGWAARREKAQGRRQKAEGGREKGEGEAGAGEWAAAADDLADMKLPRTRQSVVRKALSEPELAGVFGGARDAQDRAVLLLAYCTGARVSELCGLRWADVAERQIEGETQALILVRDGKSGEREVVVEAAAWREFKQLQGQTAEFILAGLNRWQVGRIVRRCARAGGVERAGLGPHTLRHSHATHAIVNGGAQALPQVQAQLGHASGATTQRYLSALGQRGSGQWLKVPQGKAEGGRHKAEGRRGKGEENRINAGGSVRAVTSPILLTARLAPRAGALDKWPAACYVRTATSVACGLAPRATSRSATCTWGFVQAESARGAAALVRSMGRRGSAGRGRANRAVRGGRLSVGAWLAWGWCVAQAHITRLMCGAWRPGARPSRRGGSPFAALATARCADHPLPAEGVPSLRPPIYQIPRGNYSDIFRPSGREATL